MNWDDWNFIWRSQELPQGSDAELEKLRQAFEQQHRTLRRTLAVRDFSELATGVFVIALFAHRGWRMGTSGWPFLIVIALCAGVMTVFVRERLRARRKELPVESSLREKVEADLAELRHQRRLLGTVVLWYVLPLFAATIIGFLTLALHARSAPVMHDPLFLAGFIAFFAAVGLFAWYSNHRALKRRLEPRIAELEKLHRDLVSGT